MTGTSLSELEARLAALQQELASRKTEELAASPKVLKKGSISGGGRTAEAPGTPEQAGRAHCHASNDAESLPTPLNQELAAVLVSLALRCLPGDPKALTVWAPQVPGASTMQAHKARGNALLKAGEFATAAATYSEALAAGARDGVDAALHALLLSNRSHARWCCGAFTMVRAPRSLAHIVNVLYASCWAWCW
jgi:hypothetical protein